MITIIIELRNREFVKWWLFDLMNSSRNSKFIGDGGDSFSAVLIAESFNCIDLVDILLRKCFKNALECINMKGDRRPNSSTENVEQNIGQLKHAKVDIIDRKDSAKSYQLDLKWKQNLQKCIDASPIIVKEKVIIGSHKGNYAEFCSNHNSNFPTNFIFFLSRKNPDDYHIVKEFEQLQLLPLNKLQIIFSHSIHNKKISVMKNNLF